MSLPAPQPNAWIRFLAHLLFILAAWTLFIKYLFPIGYGLAYGEPWARHIYWDLWPLAHVWLGWALLERPSYTRALAVGMSVIEILVICTLFVRFLAAPEWSIWRTNWFVNKVFVLTCFVLVLAATVPIQKNLKERPL
ncbi:hypothetical protein ACQKFL_00890 [Vreelandella titanicae]|uniref:hypothetical protein n=1 Tax=Vreelandella titanicae TaxID=664683 RepID=UPI003D04400F|tara:strand:- start:1133 stop:1546 length:414 start_codon:yes stop_codon:yes gene_type:complete